MASPLSSSLQTAINSTLLARQDVRQSVRLSNAKPTSPLPSNQVMAVQSEKWGVVVWVPWEVRDGKLTVVQANGRKQTISIPSQVSGQNSYSYNQIADRIKQVIDTGKFNVEGLSLASGQAHGTGMLLVRSNSVSTGTDWLSYLKTLPDTTENRLKIATVERVVGGISREEAAVFSGLGSTAINVGQLGPAYRLGLIDGLQSGVGNVVDILSLKPFGTNQVRILQGAREATIAEAKASGVDIGVIPDSNDRNARLFDSKTENPITRAIYERGRQDSRAAGLEIWAGSSSARSSIAGKFKSRNESRAVGSFFEVKKTNGVYVPVDKQGRVIPLDVIRKNPKEFEAYQREANRVATPADRARLNSLLGGSDDGGSAGGGSVRRTPKPPSGGGSGGLGSTRTATFNGRTASITVAEIPRATQSQGALVSSMTALRSTEPAMATKAAASLAWADGAWYVNDLMKQPKNYELLTQLKPGETIKLVCPMGSYNLDVYVSGTPAGGTRGGTLAITVASPNGTVTLHPSLSGSQNNPLEIADTVAAAVKARSGTAPTPVGKVGDGVTFNPALNFKQKELTAAQKDPGKVRILEALNAVASGQPAPPGVIFSYARNPSQWDVMDVATGQWTAVGRDPKAGTIAWKAPKAPTPAGKVGDGVTFNPALNFKQKELTVAQKDPGKVRILEALNAVASGQPAPPGVVFSYARNPSQWDVMDVATGQWTAVGRNPKAGTIAWKAPKAEQVSDLKPPVSPPLPSEVLKVTETDVRAKVIDLLNSRADTKNLNDSEKLELSKLIFVRASKVEKNTSSEVDYLKYLSNLFKTKDWPKLIASVKIPEAVDAASTRASTAARFDSYIKFPTKIEVFEEAGKRVQESADAAFKKALERHSRVFEEQRINDYAAGRLTREQALQGLTGAARERVAAALDMIDRMKLPSAGGRGGAAELEYDAKKVADAVNEFVARYGTDLGIDVGLTRTLEAALEKAIAKLGADDPARNSLIEALRHLQRHEQKSIDRTARAEGVLDAIYRNSLGTVSTQNLEILKTILERSLSRSDLPKDQRQRTEEALTRVGNQLLANRTNAARTPGGAIVKGTLPAFQSLSSLLAAAGGSLTMPQIKRINEMLISGLSLEKIPGATLEKILTDLQGGWRPATATQPSRTRADMLLTISDQSSLDIVASRMLNPDEGKTLVLVSSDANKKEMEDRLGITDARRQVAKENIERAKVKLPRIYYKSTVIVMVANNKPPADVSGKAVHPRDAVFSQLGNDAGLIRRVIGVGGAGVLDVAKGVMAFTNAEGVTTGLTGSLVTVPTVLSTTSISTLYAVFGVAPKVVTTQVPTETVIPFAEMLKGPPLDAQGNVIPGSQGRYEGGLRLTRAGLADMTASISSFAEQNYARFLQEGARGDATLLSRQRDNPNAAGPTSMLTTVGNSVDGRGTNWQTDPAALMSLIEQLHQYGVDSVDGVRVLANKVGGEHDFFDAAEALPFGKKLQHGEWVAVGTLLQLYSYGKLTGDFSSYTNYSESMKKVGLPSTIQELQTRYSVSRAEIEQAIVKAGEVNFNGLGLSNIKPLDPNAPQSRKSLFRAFLEVGLAAGASAEQRAEHFKNRAKLLLDGWIGGNQSGPGPTSLPPTGGPRGGGPLPNNEDGSVATRIPVVGDAFYTSPNRQVINTSATVTDKASGVSQTVPVSYTIRKPGTQTGEEARNFARFVQTQNDADWGSATIWGSRTQVPQGRWNDEQVPVKDRISLFNTVRGMNTITVETQVNGKAYTATIAYRVRYDPATKQNHFYVGLQTSPKGTPAEVTLSLYKLVARAALAAGYDSIYTIRDRPATNRLDKSLFGAETVREIVPGKVFYNRIPITGNPKAEQFLVD
jgi:hypothetical protein